MTFPAHIFKAYDIRGLVEGELSETLAYALGRSFVVLLDEQGVIWKGKQIVVGHDMRPTSIPFETALIRGLTDGGADVVRIGLVSTPLFNFACAHYDQHVAGIMVTASHNPAEYNGFKLTLGSGLPIGKNNGMDRLRELVGTTYSETEETGAVTDMDVLPEYISKLFSLVPRERVKPLRIVIDAANGMGKATFPVWLSTLPVEVKYLYLEPDGTFPNHEANPLKTETLAELQKQVVKTGADFGFALDGDADRIGLVDEKGSVVDASFVGTLLGLEVLRKHPSATMLYDLRQSMIVKESWEQAGASSVEKSMVGHALIKKQMKDSGAVFASELSLHLYYHDMYDVESTDLSLLYILQMLSRETKPLSELVLPLKKYVHSGEINFEVEEKDAVIARLKEQYVPDATEVSVLDGLWLGFEWGWFNVRASNTEPVLRLNLEAKDEVMMREKVGEVRALILQK
jgi:phosphomannomutase